MRATASCRTVAPVLYLSRLVFGQQSRKTGGALQFWFPLAVFAAIVLSHPIAAAPTKEIRRILILNEAGPSYPGMRPALAGSWLISYWSRSVSKAGGW